MEHDLNKRENFRRAFAEFDVEQVARFGKRDINRLLKDAGIIRNRLKIEAAINNAQRFIEVQSEFGSFDAYIWGFVDGKPIKNGFKSLKEIPAKTPLSDAISKDLMQARLQVRGIDHRVRAHAGDGDGERSHRRLLSI